MSLQTTTPIGNIPLLKSNYTHPYPQTHPQPSPLPPSAPFNFKTLLSKFRKKQRFRPSPNDIHTPHPQPSSQPHSHPHSSSQSPPQRRRNIDAQSEPSPILKFRPKSIYEVLQQSGGTERDGGTAQGRGTEQGGTKWGEDDADGVGLPTGNGGGDMDGVWIRDFAEGWGV